MILQALYDYYQKHPDLPEPGYESKEFKFEIIIDKNGRFLKLNDLRSNEKKQTGHFLHVPLGEKRTSGITPYCLWDNYGYVLGESGNVSETKQEKAPLLFKSFQAKLQSFPDEVKRDDGVHAVLEFYRTGEYLKVKDDSNWEECVKISGCNLTFRLDGDRELVGQRPAIRGYIREKFEALSKGTKDDSRGCCLITGKRAVLTRLMKATPIPDEKLAASLVNFKTNKGYDSYGKKQLYNAPMSVKAEFACSTALTALLEEGSQNRYMLGGMVFLFWTEQKESLFPVDDAMSQLFVSNKKSAADWIDPMKKMRQSVYTGQLSTQDKNRFYLLGLAQNVGRISVKTWRTGTVMELAMNIVMHFDDFNLILPQKKEIRKSVKKKKLYWAEDDMNGKISLTGILLGSAYTDLHGIKELSKKCNLLKSGFIEAAISGAPYPSSLYHFALKSVRVLNKTEHAQLDFWIQVATIKAYLNRQNRFFKLQHKEILMSLDIDNPSIGYQCGRLFAVLEKCQEEANPGINATIRDRFYGSASSTPLVSFPNLIKLSVHHLSKIEREKAQDFSRLIQEIVGRINDFPAHMTLEEQGRFAIGYYHQLQALPTEDENKSSASN